MCGVGLVLVLPPVIPTLESDSIGYGFDLISVLAKVVLNPALVYTNIHYMNL